MRRFQATSVLLLSCLLAGTAVAAEVTPGTIRETLPEAGPGLPETQAEPPLAPAPAVPKVPEGGPKILIRRFEISGNEAIPTEELHRQIADYEGKRLTLLEIYGVADLLTRYYRSRGYTLATVTVPAQEVASGVVRLHVIEGRVGKISFEGNRIYDEEFLRRQFDRIRPGDILRDDPLQNELLLLNDLPGLTARSVLAPGEEFGTTDLILETQERRFEGTAGINNHGNVAVGEWRAVATVNYNNPTGHGDYFGFTYLHGEAGELDFGQLDYEVALNTSGTRAHFYYSRNVYNVRSGAFGAAFSGSRRDGDGETFGAWLSHPFRRTLDDTLIGTLEFTRILTRQTGSGALTVTADQKQDALTLLRLGARWTHLYRDQRSVSTLGATFSTNFRRSDYTAAGLLRQNREPGKFQLDFSHYHDMRGDWSVLIRGSGAYSIGPLNDLDRFRIGGPTSIRAFAQGELSGDAGVWAGMDLMHPLPFRLPFDAPVQLRAFYDVGVVYNKNPAAGGKKTDTLSGTGVGATIQFGRDYSFDFMTAVPTTAHDAGDQRDIRYWASLNARF
ncbi:MAG: ShlB/FhaC/HecB family hemolysin secretion/activation protein [Gammaproteobacteria bacterium]|nr:MAG: ShlB/FhaC/HecB family hemolysin secretion/activation protein [Gammaproteobacteria bacterium]